MKLVTWMVAGAGMQPARSSERNAVASAAQGGFAVLILSRRVGEKIVVGKDIVIVVSKIEGNRVKLGIECDKSIPVVRAELNNKPQEREAAA